MTIALQQVELRKIDLKTRLPFRYGIATVTGEPYLVMSAAFEIDGQDVRGLAADVLPPKWFTKRHGELFEDELAEMLMVIRTACIWALQIGEEENVFRWWRRLYERQMTDAALDRSPPLLKGFAASLLERAAIDATCRRHNLPFHQAIGQNLLGIRLEELHPELAGLDPNELLPKTPRQAMSVRHTVGLSDPLLESDVGEEDRLDDGLPQSLEACLQAYGLTYLKIKLPAELAEARLRLRSIEDLLRERSDRCQFTLDGNEFYTDPAQFRRFWDKLCQDHDLQKFLQDGLKAVEQPLHRDVALSEEARRVFTAWSERPPIIIDESDGEIDSLRRALEAGYAGTSYKNCKGVIKGLANACLIEHLNRERGNNGLICTGEDLMNCGPIALLQDLAAGAVLGLTHMERNGHHYFAGLQQMPTEVQRQILTSHGDLYREH